MSAGSAGQLARYQPRPIAGHYESCVVRANHPARPLAFWIRRTLFSPKQHPEKALGELWAVVFDGGTGQHVAVKTEIPFGQCTFKSAEFCGMVGEAVGWAARIIIAARSTPSGMPGDLDF